MEVCLLCRMFHSPEINFQILPSNQKLILIILRSSFSEWFPTLHNGLNPLCVNFSLSLSQEENALLQDRLFQAQGGRPGPGSKPPFQSVDVQPPRVESVRDQTRPAPHSNGPHSVPNTGAATTTVSNPYQRTQPGVWCQAIEYR